ncbi:MAG: acetoacetate decarboxylase family protein [Armatimonadetes bacterium]|nr:acetoacetate decarboxylase family protein [Armatimonadota bacterium]
MSVSHPPAPWSLHGWSVQAVQWLEVNRVRALVPPEVQIVAFGPGRALGGLYLATYEAGSTLEYHELMTLVLARHRRRWGAWVLDIFVDDARSMAGGRGIWGLPKEMATFQWRDGDVTVCQGERPLCRLRYGRPRRLFPVTYRLPGLSLLHGKPILFRSRIRSRIALVGARWEIPPESPLARSGFSRPRLTLMQRQLRASIGQGEEIGR